MNASTTWQRLPERLRPREREVRGRGDLRRVESTLLVLALILLAIATVNDVVLQTHTNGRLTADLRTWRAVTGHNYHNISVEQDLKGHTTRDVACGNIAPGAPGALPQVCFVLTGPVVHGRRAANGGFHLPPFTADKRPNRYGCFGSAVQQRLCPP
ncbi:MAG TPA: hypothetical protein VGI76_06170 [Solirubrobacteraceae bacterium]|jgi:hypothetical protein